MEYVDKNILSVNQAINVVRDLLFNTSNKLYDLKIPFSSLPQNGHVSTFLNVNVRHILDWLDA